VSELIWKELTRAAGLEVRGETIHVRFGDERGQQVHVAEEEPGTIRVWTVAARRAAVQRLDNPELYAWLRNRLVDLVDFRVDREGQLIGEASVATPGLTAEEWALHVRTVARASDRLEYLLSGRDVE
jgi:hypothetical protein